MDFTTQYLTEANWVNVFSSTIYAIAYFDETEVLLVRFNNGKTGKYEGVPQDVYDGFLNAPSKGKYLFDVLRGGDNRRPCPRSQLDGRYGFSWLY